MSKPNKTRYRLAELRQAHADKTGGDVVEFEHNGATYTIAAPGFWDDEVKASLKAGDDVAAAQALMGDAYEDFREAGGRADDVMLVIGAYAEDQGATVGE
ncbi:hypothetical protein ACIQU6_29075 [Streptomyces sp. NPDC090442]|uniref:hypothetical protein n=1 Tax=Streptomyces sp. NPDC090442 TaxID=3365962 RepID=UPI00381D8076